MRKKVSRDLSLEDVLTYSTEWVADNSHLDWEKGNAELIEEINRMSKGALMAHLKLVYWRLDGALDMVEKLSSELTQLAQFEPRLQRIGETGVKGIIDLRMA